MAFSLSETENRLELFAHMIDKACGMNLWAFGQNKRLYSCTSTAEEEFPLFLKLGQCLDYAIDHVAEDDSPILMSDPLGMLWVAENVYYENGSSYIIILGPVFDVAASMDTLQNKLRGMNLSVALTAVVVKKLEQVPVLPIPVLYQYIKMLHWIITEKELDMNRMRLQMHENPSDKEEATEAALNPDLARMLEQEILQQIRDGNIYYVMNSNGYSRFADKYICNLDNPIRENKDTTIIFIALCSRAAMDGGLAPRIANQLEVQYIRAIEQYDDVPSLLHVIDLMINDFIRRVHACNEGPKLSLAVQECCMYVHSHLLENIRLDDMAQTIGYTGYYLTKKFKKETGQSLNDYVNHSRIQYACIQLETTGRPVQDICDELQYSSRSYFSMLFQKEMGCSPSTYRKQTREKNAAAT